MVKHITTILMLFVVILLLQISQINNGKIYAQTKINGTFEGTIKSELNKGVANTQIKLNQITDYTNGIFSQIGETTSDVYGKFRIETDKVTKVATTEATKTQSKFKAFTNANKLNLQIPAHVTITHYNLPGEKIGKTVLNKNLLAGTYDLAKYLPKNTATQIIFRRIQINEKQIVQKLVMSEGKVVLHSDGKISSLKTNKNNKIKTTQKISSIKEYSTDSLYFKVIAEASNGFTADSIIITIEDNGIDILKTGIKLNQTKIKQYINGMFHIVARDETSFEGILTEVSTYQKLEPNQGFTLVSTDTTNENGQLDLTLTKLDNTYQNNTETKEMKFIFKPLKNKYENTEITQKFEINNTDSTTQGEITANLKKEYVGETYDQEFIISDILGERKPNIEITLTNGTKTFKDTSNTSGIVNFHLEEILNPKFTLTFNDLNNTPKGYYTDKMIGITTKEFTMQDGTTTTLTIKFEGSDWKYQGKLIDYNFKENDFFINPERGGYAKIYGDELQQITFNLNKTQELTNQNRPISFVIIQDTFYTPNKYHPFEDGKIALTSPELAKYNGRFGNYNNKFRPDKILYNILSNKNQFNGETLPYQELLDRITNVNNEYMSYINESVLGVPFLKVETKWVDKIQGNPYLTDVNNQAITTAYDNDVGNAIGYDKNGQMFRSTIKLLYSSPKGVHAEEPFEGLTGMDGPSGAYMTTGGTIYDQDKDKILLFAHASINLVLLSDLGENKTPK